MKFDEFFYIQRNRDISGLAIPLDDSDHYRMRGTEEYPVTRNGKIDALEINCDISDMSDSLDLDKVTLKLVMSQGCWDGLMEQDLSYYMQFLFYDFDRAVYLFLHNARIIKFNYLPTNSGGFRVCLTIESGKCNEIPAYKIIEYSEED